MVARCSVRVADIRGGLTPKRGGAQRFRVTPKSTIIWHGRSAKTLTCRSHENSLDQTLVYVLFTDALRRNARLMWTPATAMPPSPTAAAQRLTDPERTSPAAKIPGRLVSSAAGLRLFALQAGASAMSTPVLINPLSSRSISAGNQSVHGRAPIMEKTAGVRTTLRSPVLVFSSSICSSFFPPDILRISVL